VKTPFEQGQIDGQWTRVRVSSCGFRSVQECLEHQERVYQEGLAGLSRLAASNPAYAKKHAEYLEGLVASTRASLSALL